MNKIKKGDIVGRISYGKDIVFIVERVIYTKDKKAIALLKGVTIRIQADSFLDDLELIESKQVEKHLRDLDEYVEKTIKRKTKFFEKNNGIFRERLIIHTGKILHIDGDRKYSEKSNMYYRKLGLNAIVRNIPERRQPIFIGKLLQKYKPEILVITGHDRNDKKRNRI